MLSTLALAAATVAAFFATACRIVPFRRLLGYGTALDAAFTIGTAALFYGSLGGMLIAIIAGLLMALFITAARAIFGYDRAAGWYVGPGLRPVIIWTATPPRWTLPRLPRLPHLALPLLQAWRQTRGKAHAAPKAQEVGRLEGRLEGVRGTEGPSTNANTMETPTP